MQFFQSQTPSQVAPLNIGITQCNMSDDGSEQGSASNGSQTGPGADVPARKAIPNNALPEKEKNKGTNLDNTEVITVFTATSDEIVQMLEARDDELAKEHARIDSQIKSQISRCKLLQRAPLGDETNVHGQNQSDINNASNGDDLELEEEAQLQSENLAYQASQDLVDQLLARSAFYGGMSNQWAADDTPNQEECNSSSQSQTCNEIASPTNCDVNVTESQSSQHDVEERTNLCRHNQHRKPDNISLGYKVEQNRDIDRKMAVCKEIHNVLSQVKGMRARGEHVPSIYFDKMTELASETSFQTHLEATQQGSPRQQSVPLEEQEAAALPNFRNDLLHNEGTTAPQRSHLVIKASAEQNVHRQNQETSETGGSGGDLGLVTNIRIERPNNDTSVGQRPQQQMNDFARLAESDQRTATQVDKLVAQVDLEQKKKILEELMRKDQGLISAANQDNKTSQDKAGAQVFSLHGTERASTSGERDHSPRNSRDEGLQEDLYLNDPRASNHTQSVGSNREGGHAAQDPYPSWGSSVSRVMEQYLRNGGARSGSFEENLRNFNVPPPVANGYSHQLPQSSRMNVNSQFSPVNVLNAGGDERNIIADLHQHIHQLEHQMQNMMSRQEAAQYPQYAFSHEAVSNLMNAGAHGMPLGVPTPSPGTEYFYQQMLAISQLQQSQLLAMSVNNCQQSIWHQQRELANLCASISSLQVSQRDPNYSPPVSLGQGVVFTSEATISQPVQEQSQNNLTRNTPNPNMAYCHPAQKPSYVAENQVPHDMQANGGISNARSLPNLGPNMLPTLSPVYGPGPSYAQPTSLRLNNQRGFAVGRYPAPINNRSASPHFLGSDNTRMQSAADLLTSQTFPPFAFGMPNNTNFNLPAASPMLDQASWSGNRVAVPTMALNNQVPPGNRANNYWDNFRSYSRQNLLSGSTKTNEASSSHPIYPIPDRTVNSVYSVGQIQEAQTQSPHSQVKHTGRQKRNLNMQGVSLQGSPVMNQDISPPSMALMDGLKATEGKLRRNVGASRRSNCLPHNHVYRVHYPRNPAAECVEYGRENNPNSAGPLLAVHHPSSESNRPPSESSEDGRLKTLESTARRMQNRSNPLEMHTLDLSDVINLRNIPASILSQAPQDISYSQLLERIQPDSSSDEELPSGSMLSAPQGPTRTKHLKAKQSNRAADRSGLSHPEDTPPSYDALGSGFTVPTVLQESGYNSCRWYPPDMTYDEMTFSYTAEYFRCHEQTIIDKAMIEDLMVTMQEKMFGLVNHPWNQLEKEHNQNLLITLKAELQFYMGRKCRDVVSQLLLNLRKTLFEFGFTPNPNQCVVGLPSQIESVACESSSDSQWDPGSLSPPQSRRHPPNPEGLLRVYTSSDAQARFTGLIPQPLNSDRDLAEADQSHNESVWQVRERSPTPPSHNQQRMQNESLVTGSVARMPDIELAPPSTTSDVGLSYIYWPDGSTEDITLPSGSHWEPHNQGMIAVLDMIPTRLSESQQQPSENSSEQQNSTADRNNTIASPDPPQTVGGDAG